jgi:hypothetical protein
MQQTKTGNLPSMSAMRDSYLILSFGTLDFLVGKDLRVNKLSIIWLA